MAFDEGVLAYKLEGGELVVVVACGLDPRDWLPVANLGNELYGQGDLFLDVFPLEPEAVDETDGEEGGSRHHRPGARGRRSRSRAKTVDHFALLNDMNSGRPLGHKGWWDAAQGFRTNSEEENGNGDGQGYGHGKRALVGELVALQSEADVQCSGGYRGHRRGHESPRGLDERVFARGGIRKNTGSLTHRSIQAQQPLARKSRSEKMTWFLSEWRVPVSSLGSSPMKVVFHIATTCGNDQIAGVLDLDENKLRGRVKSPAKKKLLH